MSRPSARAVIVVTVLLSIGAILTVVLATRSAGGVVAGLDAGLFEWSFRGRESLLVICTVGLLSAVAALAAWTDVHQGGTRDRRGPGLPVAAIAVSWAALPVAIWYSSPLARALAFVAVCLLPAALLHVTAVVLAGLPSTSVVVRRVVPAAYLVLAALALLRVLSRDPFLDPGCVVYCHPRSPLIPSAELAAVVSVGIRLVWGAVSVGTLALSLTALLRSRELTLRIAAAGAGACGLLDLVWSHAPLARAGLGPPRFDMPHLLEVRAGAYTILGAALLWLGAQRLRRRATFQRLARDIAEVTPPRTLRDVLGTRLGDPSAEIHFRVPSEGLWVDELGRPVAEDLPASDHQTATVHHDGQNIARIRFNVPGAQGRDLETVLGPATFLALDGERAQAETSWRLAMLRETRRQAVEAADVARRRAERDMHDGAQHRLLAATFALQSGVRLSRESGDTTAETVLTRAVAKVSEAAAELRTIAHGMYPTLLGDAGLVPAVEGLVLSNDAMTTLDATPVPRADPSVELTAYQAVALALRGASERPIGIQLGYEQGLLTVTLQGAILDESESSALADRTAALGGRMTTDDAALRIELPCG